MKIIITIYFWLIISQFANFILAQSKELEVQEKPAGKILQIMDEKSALILIYSELDLTFPNYDRIKTAPIETNKVSSPYTYKLLVTAEYKTIQLRVSANGFIPKTIEINDISPKKTVVLNIFEKSVLNLSKGEFHLTTEPGGAKITIDGQPTFEKFTPYTFTNWTAQAYRVTLYKENYYVHIDTIIIDKDKANSLNVKLRAKFGILVLSTDPANELLIDGKSYDHKNPVQISEGDHYITVRRKYFKDYVDTIYIVGQYEPMMIENEIDLEPYMGTITVTSEPSGAEVYLNGNTIGITPLNKTVNAGYYTLELNKDDYRKEAMNVEILKDESVNKSVELKKTGILIIVGIINTKVTLNGKNKGLLGNNRKSEFELPAGEYVIRAELEGFDTEEFSFELASERKTIDISLTEMDNPITVAIIKTNMGTIEIELFVDKTPKTVENFVGLANRGYYNDVIFHRVIKNFMIQGGDPTGTGRGGASFWGGKFEDEIVSSLKHDVPGILSMANAGPNTNGSQFFITLVPTSWLDGKHTVFGKVIAGMDVVYEIGETKAGALDRPISTIIIEKITIEKRQEPKVGK